MSTQSVEASDIQLTWTFGDRLRKVRRILGMSQEAFAKLLGATPQALGAWELDVNAPRNVVAIAKRLEVAAGVPATWMLGLVAEGTMKPPAGETDEGLVVRRQGLEPRTR